MPSIGKSGKLAHIVATGVAARALPGEETSGDIYVVRPTGDTVLVAVVDALGHGAEAAATARIAAASLEETAGAPIPDVLEDCHRALIGTRGAVMSVASLSVTERTMTWVGVGDVEGVLVLADPVAVPAMATLMTRGGIVGATLPSVRPWVIPVSTGDTLIFATDGIRSGSAGSFPHAGSPQQVADSILLRGFKGTDDALVLVARMRFDQEEPT